MRVPIPAFLIALFVSSAVFADLIEPIPMAPVTMEELARAPVPISAAALPLPSAIVGFRSTSGQNFYPADAGGAVNAKYVVGVSNNGIVVQDRTGKQLSSVGLGQFWTDPAFPSGGVYAPRIIYDAANDRWVLITLFDINFRNGALLIAFTAGGDPTGTWNRYRVPIEPTGQRIADVPHMAQTADAVVVSMEEWSDDFAWGTGTFVIAKSYAAAPTVNASHFFSAHDVVSLSSNDASRKTAEIEGQQLTLRDLTATSLANPVGYRTTIPFQHGFAQLLGPQLGSTKLMDCGDTLVQGGVVRNGVTWVVHTVKMSQFRTAILVWRVSGGVAKTYLIEDQEIVFAFPSIAVNRFGAVLIAYSMFSSSTYPSAGYSYIDPAGNLSAPAVLKRGDTPYVIDRWGSYTTTVVDPVDDTAFWTVQIVPQQVNVWSTWWSYIPVTGLGRGRAARH